jgi:hypothetical protein
MRNEVADFVGVQGFVWCLGLINCLIFPFGVHHSCMECGGRFLLFGWVCSMSLEKRRRLMINGDGAELLDERKGCER